jgi:hypothetical protein
MSSDSKETVELSASVAKLSMAPQLSGADICVHGLKKHCKPRRPGVGPPVARSASRGFS